MGQVAREEIATHSRRGCHPLECRTVTLYDRVLLVSGLPARFGAKEIHSVDLYRHSTTPVASLVASSYFLVLAHPRWPMSSKNSEKNKKKRIAKKKAAKKKAATRNAKPKLSVIEGGGDMPSLPDRRAMEGAMADFFGGGSRGPDDEAQDLMYEAWETANQRKRLSLARQALKVSPNCADAYVMLAEEAASSLDEAISYYRQGTEAGERRLGARALEEDVGHFWGILETRPYMRARAGLAQCLWQAGRHDDAIEHYREMLRLNPGDNQGLRYTLLACLMELGRDDEALALHKQYEDDCMAAWTYASALLSYRHKGDTSTSRKALKGAIKGNPHVPTFLLGDKKLPARLPDYIGFGDENEAVTYAAENMAGWRKTDGALDWLRANA